MNKDKKQKYEKIIKIILLIICIIIILLLLIFDVKTSTSETKSTISYSEFTKKLDSGEIEYISFLDSKSMMRVKLKNGEEYKMVNPDNDSFKLDLLKNGVEIRFQRYSLDEAILLLFAKIPIIIFMVFIIFYTTKIFSFGSKTMFNVLKPQEMVKFSDIAGLTETKKEVMFAIDQLKNIDLLNDLGAVPTNGIILEGPPGTGKTMLAKAIAGEADVPFINTCGSDFIEMFAGLGSARVRSLWKLAEKKAPCVVFIDEIDAIGRKRTSGGDGAAMESNQTLNALLQKMDGVGVNKGIFVIGATNRINDLDNALLRPGRFDKHIYVGIPHSKKDRDDIICVHLKNKKLSDNVKLDDISKLLFGLSGAEIAQVVNESVLISLQEGRNGIIELCDVDSAMMKLRLSGVVSEYTSELDKKIAAVHESGHAIVSKELGIGVSKVSIIPYSSGVGGVTIGDTDSLDKQLYSQRHDIINDIRIALAGKVAETIIFGECSNGCSNDIEKASILAYNYVTRYGMYENILINVNAIDRGFNMNKEYIDKANNLLCKEYEFVEALLNEKLDDLNNLTERLLTYETVIDV